MTESFIEDRFVQFWGKHGWGLKLVEQYEVLSPYELYPYRLDFYHVDSNTAIELDGREWHTSREQVERDKAREKWIGGQMPGVVFVRFTGSEVMRQPVKCVYKARGIIKSRLSSERALLEGTRTG